MSRNFTVAVKNVDEFFSEAGEVLRNADRGIIAEKPLERVYFNDIKTFLKYITPRRYDLLDKLHRQGPMSIRGLAKLLQRHYKNVYDDVKLLEQIGLIEKSEAGLYCVPWDEVTATFRLAA